MRAQKCFRCLVVTAVGWFGMSYSVKVSACGASPEQEWTLESVIPSAGATGVLLNQGIVLPRLPWVEGGLSSLTATELNVTTSDGQAVAGDWVSWVNDANWAVWAPYSPLLADTEYQAHAKVAEAVSALATRGAAELQFTFTTGQELAPPLELKGELSVHVEMRDVEYAGPECQGPCGGRPTCVSGIRAAYVAVIETPQLSGGYAANGYVAMFSYSMDLPYIEPADEGSPNGSPLNVQWAAPEEGAPLHFEQELADFEHVACFAVNVWDTGGQRATLSRCLESAGMPPTPSDAGAPVSSPTNAAQSPLIGLEDGNSNSCSLSGHPARRSKGALALLVLVASFAALRGRKRPPDA